MSSICPDLSEIPVSPEPFAVDLNDPNEIPQSPPEIDAAIDDLPAETPISDEARQNNDIPDLNQAVGRRKELTKAERLAAYAMLLERSDNGKLGFTTTGEVAQCFGVGIRTIQRLWKRTRESGNHLHANGRVNNCGRKRVEFNLERIKDVPLRQRTTLRSLAAVIGVSKSYLHLKLKEGVIRRHSNAIHPSLTDQNLTSRLSHCLSSLDSATLPADPAFKPMQNVIHIDEKWFFLTKRSQCYYLLHDEDDPVRTIKSANFIPKLMFLVAVARPRYDYDGSCTFDGKIGVFPLVECVAAVRSSQNRPRGTMEIKPIPKISRNIIREFMIHKVLPAIASKWPRDSIREPFFIQQDNAPSHIATDDVEFLNAVDQSGMNVSLVCQPPNSPDLNVLDLGFFRAIQSLHSKNCVKTMSALVVAVEQAFFEFNDRKSNNIFITLQSCMIEVLKCGGSNTYKIPHIRKAHLARVGTLPSILPCNPEIYATAMYQLSQR